VTGTITKSPCPQCGEVGYLHITTRFVFKPLGTWSLAGAQDKTTGRMQPVLKCHNCSLDLIGEFDGEHHAAFDPPAPTGKPS